MHLLPPAYVVRREGNSFTLFVSSHLGGVPVSHNALQHFPECHGAAGGVPCQVQPGGGVPWPGGVPCQVQPGGYPAQGGTLAGGGNLPRERGTAQWHSCTSTLVWIFLVKGGRQWHSCKPTRLQALCIRFLPAIAMWKKSPLWKAHIDKKIDDGKVRNHSSVATAVWGLHVETPHLRILYFFCRHRKSMGDPNFKVITSII